ncbi:discoidin domain-containing protein, partial [Pyxidicoccus fallax]|nr:discoidin domain-containing protein [Pyxidicoccus fallax]
LLATPAAASNAAPGYAETTDWLERQSQPERYTPLNLLDGRDTTAWCATGEDPAPITIGFKDAVTVDEVRVYTGDGTDRAAFKARARVKKFTLTSVDASRSLTVEDKRGLQVVRLSQPLPGARFILEVVDRFPGASDDAPVCITDLVFVSGGKALNGTFLASRLKYDARLAPLLGTWFGGLEGAPESFLSFYLDGTFRYTREPLEGGGPTSVTGTYTLSGSRLSLDVPKRGKATARLVKGGEAGTRSPEASLEVEGPLAEDWGREFRGRP